MYHLLSCIFILERERQARLEQERKQREYENSFEGKAEKFFNGLGSLIHNIVYTIIDLNDHIMK